MRVIEPSIGADGDFDMKFVLLVATSLMATSAFAQDVPKVGGKQLAQVKPKGPMGCKLVGTVRGTKLWAGECTAAESGGASAVTDPQPSLPAQASEAIPPGQKQ
jgi:hypothetical protein